MTPPTGASEHDGWVIVQVHGDVDLATVPELHQRLLETMGGGHYRIVVDLTDAGFLDSSGLSVLAAGLKRVRAHGGEIRLVCTAAPVLKTLELTGLHRIFAVGRSVDEVVARHL